MILQVWVAFYGPETINTNVGTLNVKGIFEERDNKHMDEEIRLVEIECMVKELIKLKVDVRNTKCKCYNELTYSFDNWRSDTKDSGMDPVKLLFCKYLINKNPHNSKRGKANIIKQ